MSTVWTMAYAACAAASGAGAMFSGVYLHGARVRRARRRRAALAAQGVRQAHSAQSAAGDVRDIVIRYAEALTRRLYMGETAPLSPSARAGRAGKTRAGKQYLRVAASAGCGKTISVAAYCEARLRLSIVTGLVGVIFGALVSNELALVLALAGLVVGRSLPARSVIALSRRRAACAGRHLSEMLEVVALGLRSGLTFDRSFALYGAYFDNDFARACARAHRAWSLGLQDRDDSLRELAASFDCSQLSRIVDVMLRGLRFGTSITASLEDAAMQSRATYRAALEERVAKAPVKMMLPTGALILPAMLLLVMGPILLELAGGF